jgi:hypothetical protein
MTKIEQLNLLVRSIVTLGLTAGVLYGFIVAKSIPPDVFVPLAGGILTWWFVRDQASASTKEAAEMIKTPPPNGGTNAPKP